VVKGRIMTKLTLPTPPDVSGLSTLNAADALGSWLFKVARERGEPAVRHAVGAGWPGTAEQRKHLAPGHVERAINEARQVSSEVWAKEARQRGEWGV
jgi:hypothetical protein